MKKCPFCAEAIQDEAIVCRYCGRDLPTVTRSPEVVFRKESNVNQTSNSETAGLKTWLSILSIIVVVLLAVGLVWLAVDIKDNLDTLNDGEYYDEEYGGYELYTMDDFYYDLQFDIGIVLIPFIFFSLGLGGAWFFYKRGQTGAAYALSGAILVIIVICGMSTMLIGLLILL